MKRSFLVFVFSVLAVPFVVYALPALSEANIKKHSPTIRYWNIKAGGETTGTVTRQEGSFKVERETKIRQGSVCHNYGESCFCASSVKFRIIPSVESQWAALVDTGTQSETSCPDGIQPTGDKVSQSLTPEESAKKRQEIMDMKKAKRKSSLPGL